MGLCQSRPEPLYDLFPIAVSRMPQGISPSMQRLIRRKLSRVLGGQAQVISLKEIKRKGEWQGYCEVEGRLAQFRFIRGGRQLVVQPLLNVFRWDRSA